MSEELIQLNNKIAESKQKIKKLVDENKISAAATEKENLKKLGAKFDLLYDLEQSNKEKVEDKIKNGNIHKASQKFMDKNNNVLNIINKDESFKKAIIRDTENLSVGKYVKGMLTGIWDNAKNEMEQFKALSTKTGSVLVPTELSATIIDLARPMMALSDIPIIPMDSNNLTIAKIVNDPVINFKGELEKAELSDMTFGAVELKSKTIYGLMKISLEMLDSAKNIDGVITNAMAKALAQGIDKNGLYGDGELSPKGILTYENINIVESEGVETSKYSSFVKGIGAITKANGIPTTMSFNSDIDTELGLLTDTLGQPLNMPKKVEELEYKVSNNLKDNQSMVFDRNAIVMGVQNRIKIDSTNAAGFEDGSVLLRVYAYIDFAILQPKHITRIDYKATAPTPTN